MENGSFAKNLQYVNSIYLTIFYGVRKAIIKGLQD